MSANKKVPIKIDSLTTNNLEIFNKISAPTEYPEQYLQQCRESGELSKYAYYSEVPVGLVVLQPVVHKCPVALEISVLKVLTHYSWAFGVEKELIQYAIDLCPKRHVKSCVIVVDNSNTKLTELLRDIGFKEDDHTKDIYKNVTIVPDNQRLFVYSCS